MSVWCPDYWRSGINSAIQGSDWEHWSQFAGRAVAWPGVWNAEFIPQERASSAAWGIALAVFGNDFEQKVAKRAKVNCRGRKVEPFASFANFC